MTLYLVGVIFILFLLCVYLNIKLINSRKARKASIDLEFATSKDMLDEMRKRQTSFIYLSDPQCEVILHLLDSDEAEELLSNTLRLISKVKVQ